MTDNGQLQMTYVGITSGDASEGEEEQSALLVGRHAGPSSPAVGGLHQQAPTDLQQRWRTLTDRVPWRVVVIASIILSLYALSTTALLVALSTTNTSEAGSTAAWRDDAADDDDDVTHLATHPGHTTTIAFGSCTAYDFTYQSLWEQAVLPTNPDAWLWVGDMTYLDTALVDCEHYPHHAGCQCAQDYLHHPWQCFAGDVEHAAYKWQAMFDLQHGYRAFLESMCPGSTAAGMMPPPGWDVTHCPRPVLGIYDDHDYGWNNGNKRLPNKVAFKNMYMDAIGESRSSVRRSSTRGGYWQYVLNAGHEGKEVDIVLLDGRWDRDDLPCAVRRQWCEQKLQGPTPDPVYDGWCRDFLSTPQPTSANGSCCTADDMFAHGWCLQAASRSHTLYGTLCDPTHSDYGMRPYVIRNGQPAEPDPQSASDYHNRAPFCDVLGGQQRRWLKHALRRHNTAPLHIIVSGSVVLGRPDSKNTPTNPSDQCSGDDWECYRPAQAALLSDIATAASEEDAHGGCWVMLVGDYHYSDIKVVKGGGEDVLTEKWYPVLGKMPTPLYQVMASGMTNSTARPGRACSGWMRDDVGLRHGGPCAYVDQPSFGTVMVDWRSYELRLQLRLAVNGSVAHERVVNLATCQPA